MWGLTIVGEDSLCAYGQLQVWSRSGAVHANLDFSDSMVWAEDPEEEFRVQLKWPEILVPGSTYRCSIGFDSDEHLPAWLCP